MNESKLKCWRHRYINALKSIYDKNCHNYITDEFDVGDMNPGELLERLKKKKEELFFKMHFKT